ILEAFGDPGQAPDQGREDFGERARHLALDLGFGLPGTPGRGGMQANEQLCRTAPSALVLSRDAGRAALLAEPGGTVRGWIAAHEGERDRAVDVGEDDSGAGPEAVEQAAQLVGQTDALSDQLVTTAGQGAQSLRRVGAGGEGTEA